MMKKRWLALLLAAAMLFPTAAGLISCQTHNKETGQAPVDDAAMPSADTPLTSAQAMDLGDMTYYLDNEGNLWASYTDHSTEIAALAATQICIVGSTLWYASQNTLSTYDLTTGETAVYAQRDEAITTFALCGDRVYYLCGDKLLCGDEILLDLSSRPAPDGGALSTVCDFELREADQILLYLPNPHYQDEEIVPGYLLAEHNDTYITYAYTISQDALEAYDYYENQEDPSFASSTGSISINGVTFPFEEYPVGSYFSQNGKACKCHTGGCVTNTKSGENCLRYWPSKSNRQVDLKGVQCMGFARFCQWRLYGTHDYGNSTDFYNALGGTFTAGNWTANTFKNILTDVGPGGHIRTAAGHSLFVISVSNSGFVTYECNTKNKDCKVFTRQWTWDTFYDYAGSRGLLYYNMPRNVDNGDSVTPDQGYEVGSYQISASSGLNLRAQANTSSSVLVTIPNNTIVQVTSVQKVGNYYWGYTNYNGKSGWIRLDYALYQSATISAIEITSFPDKTTYTVGDSFSTVGMTVEAKFSDGTAFEIAGYSCSGYNMSKAGTYTVKVTYGSFSDTFTITVKEKNIPPTSITLELTQLTLIVGDTYELEYTLLPADTTQKTITWTSSSPAAVTVSEGTVNAAAPGSAAITAKTQNGLTAVCLVTVIIMPTGTNWSATVDGNPLPSLPIGIEPVDYSIRYRLPAGNGWGDWIYGEIPSDARGYQCQFRPFTATFVNTLDGQTVDLFTVEFNQVIDLSRYVMTREGYLFTGWYYDPQSAETHNSANAAPRRITITEDLLLYAGWIPISTISSDSSDPFGMGAMVPAFGIAGVEMRVAGDATGLRFMGRISTTLIAELEGVHSSNKSLQPSKATDTGIGFGMVVRMKSTSTKPLTKAEDSYLYQGGTVTVPAQRTYAAYNGYILFNAFVCGYTSDYYKTDFIARPYLTYADANGITHTYYFTATGSNTQGGGYYTNLYAEAQKLVATEGLDPVTKKWLEDTILN